MDSKIKSEFKEFISTLSTEICKEILLEELKDINNSFGQTSDIYKRLGVNYAENINGIKDQLIQLQNTNKKLNEFIANLTVNNDKVNKALGVIDGSHKKVIDNIITDNKKLFDEYSKKVQALNDSEKKQFISELISNMNIQSQKYLAEVKSVVNGSKVEEVLKNTSILINKMNSVETQITNVVGNLVSSEKKIIEDINKKVDNTENQLKTKINETNSKIDNTLNEFNNKIINLNLQLNKKNNISMILTSIIVVLCTVILFKK